MDVSVIIVNYNTCEITKNCLKSVFEQTIGIEFEVIVSDNGSKDGSIEMIRTDFPQVIFIENNANPGFGTANNRALAVAKGKYVFYLNSDTLLLNNAVKIFFDYWENAAEKQKMSFGFDWFYPKAGIELYAEVGIDDFLQGGFIKGLSRYPFDSLVYTCGVKKTVNLPFAPKLKGEIIFEYSDFEEPRNKISGKGKYAFNMHHQISQGLTNRGQYIGSYLGTGGNAQTLKLILYYPKGVSSLKIARSNPDNTFMYWRVANENQWYKADIEVVGSSTYFITSRLSVFGSFGWNWKINPYYDIKKDVENIHNFILQTGLKFNI